jgi:ABC-type sugar transport system substrate-binding protein
MRNQNRPSVTALFCVLLLACGLAACGGEGEGSSEAKKSGSSGSEEIRLGLVLPDLTNQTISDIYSGAKARAAELGTVKITQGGQSAAQAWLTACNQIVSSGIDVLAYDTLDAASTSSCIQKANDLDIKTICLFACTAAGHNDVLITLDFEDVGVTIGTWMAETIGANAEYGLLAGPTGDGALQALQKGYLETMEEKCSGCKLVANVPAGGTTAASGYTSGLQVLTAHPNIKGIYAANDDVAQGLVRAVGQVNKLGKIQVAGVNGTCIALKSILDQKQNFTVLVAGQPFGQQVVDGAVKLVAGEPVDKTVNVQTTGIDHKIATDTLSGAMPDPEGVNLKERLTQAQAGCN